MDRGALKRSTLAFRHLLEGFWDGGTWIPGDLELVLRGYGIFRDRDWLEPARLPHLDDEGLALRARLEQAIKSLIPSLPDSDRRPEREASRNATALYIQEAAYTWFNRLLALRCLEVRVPGVDEAIKLKPDYAGRSLRHDRFCRQHPELCQGEDGGLVAFLRQVCAEAVSELPLLFSPDSPFTLVAPSPDALQKCVRALSGEVVVLTRRTSDRAEGLTDDVFGEPDLLGWVYQYWNAEEKARVDEQAKRGEKVEGPDIIPKTCLYTEDYMVRFLVENSLGALWVEMRPDSKLPDRWDYFVRDGARRRPHGPRSVQDITFFDPACGSGHFLVYAFDVLWEMYQDEGRVTDPVEICRTILERNLYGADIDERSVQIAAVALYLKAKERAPQFRPRKVNLVAANASVPPDAVQRYLKAHPEDEPLRGVLDAIFAGLENVSEVGSLLQVEEQLDRALEDLRKREARRASGGESQASMLPLLGLPTPPVQGPLELDSISAWAAWRSAVLDRLHKHFQSEANAVDLSTAIFGAHAEKGLDLIELLSRRYDLVSTNPPYMGSKSMGSRLKSYVQRHYAEGKRDLYAAFIQRCLQLAKHGGRVAMVTQQSWMFLRTSTELRREVMEHQAIDRLAHLGPRAFEEISGEVVNVALFVLRGMAPAAEDRIWAARLVGPKSAIDKSVLLRRAASGEVPTVVFTPKQTDFLPIAQTPFVYWLQPVFLELLGAPVRLETQILTSEGLGTRDDERFVRYFWEAPGKSTRWFPFVKGGGYRRWWGLNYWVVDYREEGAAIKAHVVRRFPYLKGNYSWLVRDPVLYGKPGLTFTDIANGSLGVRFMPERAIFTDKGPALFAKSRSLESLAAYLNSPLATYLLRALSPTFQFRTGYIRVLPTCPEELEDVGPLVVTALTCQRELSASELAERSFLASSVRPESKAQSSADVLPEAEASASILHTTESVIWKRVLGAFGIQHDAAQIFSETATPAGWFSLISGYDAIPKLRGGVEMPPELIAALSVHGRLSLPSEHLVGLRERLRSLYEAGPGAKEDSEGESLVGDDEEDAEEVVALGARIPIPMQTFVEELAQKLEIHPISVYWLLRELREREGLTCLPEARRRVEDYVTVTVLCLLGHRWPEQIEADEPVPEWADANGIVALTGGTGERTLLDRVRERIGADFGEGRIDPIEQEFRQLVGRTLSDWLARDFFLRHISQFKKRPVAWLLESSRAVDTRWEATHDRRGSRRLSRVRAPAFACLVYYHKLTADTLSRIKTHYVRPVLQRREFELAEERRRSAEGNVAARAVAERLTDIVDELKAFEAALDTVTTKGFWSRRLEELLVKEETDHWTRRSPYTAVPDREAFLRQEQAYEPDLNDGVRVNIAPLQKYGLLAADVIAAKDVEKAIADRAAWRSDERRLSREGKLSKPGWWRDDD